MGVCGYWTGAFVQLGESKLEAFALKERGPVYLLS
jgi:hypothetical protein